MKRFIKILIITTFIILNTFTPTLNLAHAKSQSSVDVDKQNYGYYKCLSSCLFFKSSDITDMSLENIYFSIPEGYFVKKISDITATTLKVSYNNKIGYVMTERVKLVSFLPSIKYLDEITFDISSSSGTQLWSIPSSENSTNIIFKHIEAGTKNITYIASVNGEIPRGATSSIWYYCSYSPSSDPTSVYEGYIHSEKTTNLSKIPPNEEDDVVINEVNNNSTPYSLPTVTQTILITIISLPLLIIIVLLLLGSKRKEKLKFQSEMMASNNTTDYIDEPQQKVHKLQSYKEMEGKKYSIKDKFNDFMFESEKKTINHNTSNFTFQSLDSIEDDDLL